MSKTYISKALRERIATPGRYRCGYCLTQERVVGVPMDVEHIIPEVLGGLTEEDNLWLACSLCNSHKGERVTALDPVTGDRVSLFNPQRQVWQAHFAWGDNGAIVDALSRISEHLSSRFPCYCGGRSYKTRSTISSG